MPHGDGGLGTSLYYHGNEHFSRRNHFCHRSGPNFIISGVTIVLVVARMLRNHFSQFLFLGNYDTRIGARFLRNRGSQFLILGNRATSTSYFLLPAKPSFLPPFASID